MYGYTIFCDDIRHEVGGKLSYMGAYNGSLHVMTGAATTLPRLATAMTVVIPEGVEVTSPIEFALLREVNGTVTELLRATPEGLPQPIPAAASGKVNRVSMNFQLSPFVIDNDAILRARAYVDGEEVKIGALALSLSPPTEAGSIDPDE